MPNEGWNRLLTDAPWYRGEGRYPIAAYSEFMPPPRLGVKPYGVEEPGAYDPADPCGWQISEYEQAMQLQPGMQLLAQEILHVLDHLGHGRPAHGIARNKLRDNPYWPAAMQKAGAPPHERYMILLPLVLSQTQDDKGRVRWTLFGASEQGPGRAFWRSFFVMPKGTVPFSPSRKSGQSPKGERSSQWALDFFRRLLGKAYGLPEKELDDLRRAGFRIHRTADDPSSKDGPLPSWTKNFLWTADQSLRGVRYLLNFCPFERLPATVQRAYLGGRLHLLPFPGSLVFFGAQPYRKLQRRLPTAMQIPLLHSLHRHEAPWGIRVPQSGWLHEATADSPEPHEDFGPLRGSFRRTHRWARVHRHEDELGTVAAGEDKVAHVLFSSAADDLGLYGKPMARNAQIWTSDYRLLLDGPGATPEQLAAAAAKLQAGGLFGYRFVYPPMQVGRHAIYWHVPLVAFPAADGTAVLLDDPPRGHILAQDTDGGRSAPRVELWPRLLDRPLHREAIRLFMHDHDTHFHRDLVNVRKVLDAHQLGGGVPLDKGFARQLLTLPKEETWDHWLESLPGQAADPAAAKLLVEHLRALIVDDPPSDASLTFKHTANRTFEELYWKTIDSLASGRFVNKDNADCVLDRTTQQRLAHHHRDLEVLGDHLLDYYQKQVEAAGMEGLATLGEMPFQWQTDFDFPWSGGWAGNQTGKLFERDLMLVIPGRNRRQAIVMADHYDTAYMEDVYGPGPGGGPRVSAAGADDNHSATAALMLAAPILLRLSREGRLERDVWLVHLTGEEFPSDCMGARHLCQLLVEGRLRIRQPNKRWRSFAQTRVEGVYVLDMIAHNNDKDRDIFQVCPGTCRQSMWLARQAQAANAAWNASVAAWNASDGRKRRGRRSADGSMPQAAPHPSLHGQVRPAYNPHSTLYNTDGQIFSDAGVPVVLFMENYDINRKGYHDTHDTMANIDLDYGAALAAITIESVARAASEPLPKG